MKVGTLPGRPLNVRRLPGWTLPSREADAAPGGGRTEAGSAVVEFVLVAVLLLFLLLSVVQVAIYLHVRNVAAASAAEGARYAANSDVDTAAGATRAHELLTKGVGGETAGRVTCVAADEHDPQAAPVVQVRCAGQLPVFFLPIGGHIPLDVSGRALDEQ